MEKTVNICLLQNDFFNLVQLFKCSVNCVSYNTISLAQAVSTITLTIFNRKSNKSPPHHYFRCIASIEETRVINEADVEDIPEKEQPSAVTKNHFNRSSVGSVGPINVQFIPCAAIYILVTGY